jgi:hypothetical protein
MKANVWAHLQALQQGVAAVEEPPQAQPGAQWLAVGVQRAGVEVALTRAFAQHEQTQQLERLELRQHLQNQP